VTPAEALTARLGGRWHGGYGAARCPMHDDRHPSLSIRDGDRGILMKCHGGCDSKAIIDELKRRGRWDRRPAEPPQRKPKHSEAERIRYFRDLWHASGPIGGTIGETYMRGRGIILDLPPSLRFRSKVRIAGSSDYIGPS
jgi:putative DNA primase/helicase